MTDIFIILSESSDGRKLLIKSGIFNKLKEICQGEDCIQLLVQMMIIFPQETSQEHVSNLLELLNSDSIVHINTTFYLLENLVNSQF